MKSSAERFILRVGLSAVVLASLDKVELVQLSVVSSAVFTDTDMCSEQVLSQSKAVGNTDIREQDTACIQ